MTNHSFQINRKRKEGHRDGREGETGNIENRGLDEIYEVIRIEDLGVRLWVMNCFLAKSRS